MVDMCKTILDYEGNGVMPMLYSIRDCVPSAFNILLIAIFFVLFGGNYYLIKNKTGRAKVLVALLASSFLMVVLSMFLALGALVTYKTVLGYTFILIISFIAFNLSDNQ